MRGARVFLFSLATAAVVASTAAAAGTLDGELLSAVGTVTATGSCNPEGTSTVTFHAEGTATGPYPGTFTEDGTITLGPQPLTEDFLFWTISLGTVSDTQITFTIDSGDTTITGTKTIDPQFPPFAQGVCSTLGVVDTEFGTFGPGAVYAAQDPPLVYQATIHDPSGTSTDTGRSGLGFSVTDFEGPGGAQHIGGLTEAFASTAPPQQQPATVGLTPAAAVNAVGTSHTVTADVRDATAQPVSGATVVFSVAGATSTTGSCTTGADGTCTFTYEGPVFPGADTITGCVGADGSPPCGTATKTWVLPASTPGKATGGGQVPPGVELAFVAKSNGISARGSCRVGPVKCVDVLAYVQAGKTATFYGHTASGALYRARATDLAEPGAGSDTFDLVTSDGYSAGGILSAGDIEVH